jgi:hypothetical protein
VELWIYGIHQTVSVEGLRERRGGPVEGILHK